MGYRKLGVKSEHRKSMLANLVISLINHERITTTLTRAKEVAPIAEKMITLAKDGSQHSQRRAFQALGNKESVKKLFNEEFSGRFKDRTGGYTRIIKIGPRQGDGAEMAILEYLA